MIHASSTSMNWPDAIALSMLFVCLLGAWAAWLKWGDR